MFMAIVVTGGLIVTISHCMWYRPTNMRQAGSQTKLLHVKANVVPSHLRVSHGTILLCKNLYVHLGKSVYAWVADTLGEYKLIKGNETK